MTRGRSATRHAGPPAILSLFAAVLLAGCATLGGKLETPRLSLVGIQLQDASFFEQRLRVRLRVQNPNDLVLPVRGIDVQFELDGEDFAPGVSERAFEVPAFGEAEFDMLVTANAATALLRILDKDRGGRLETLDYRIRGKLSTSLGLLRSVPFDERGTISLDSLARGRAGG
jgi:LEA14-like dessication related protein